MFKPTQNSKETVITTDLISSVEYKRMEMVGFAVFILVLGAVIGLSIISWNFLLGSIILSGTVVGSGPFFHEGWISHRVELYHDRVIRYKRGNAIAQMHEGGIARVVYEISENVMGEGGISYMRELRFEGGRGDRVIVKMESQFKTRYLDLDKFALDVQEWCDGRGIDYQAGVLLPSDKFSDEERKKKFTRLTTPPPGNIDDWKRSVRFHGAVLVLLSIFGVTGLSVAIGASSSPAKLGILSFFMLFFIGCCYLPIFLNKLQNEKPISSREEGNAHYHLRQIMKENIPDVNGSKIGIILLSCCIGFLITLMTPVFVIETRVTRGLFGIGLSEAIGTMPWLFFIPHVFKKENWRKGKERNRIVALVSISIPISLLGMVLGFVGYLLG